MFDRLFRTSWILLAIPAMAAAVVVFALVRLLQENRQRRREVARLNAEARARQQRRRASR